MLQLNLVCLHVLIWMLAMAPPAICEDACLSLDGTTLRAKWMEVLSKEHKCPGPLHMSDLPPIISLNYLNNVSTESTLCAGSCTGLADNCAVCASPPLLGVSQIDCSNDEGRDDLELRSLCKWYYTLTNNTKRYPPQMAEAQCCCNTQSTKYPGCLPCDGCQCEPILHHITVLMQTNEEDPDKPGYCLYKAKKQPLAVGCTASKTYAPMSATVSKGGGEGATNSSDATTE